MNNIDTLNLICFKYVVFFKNSRPVSFSNEFISHLVSYYFNIS